MKRIGATVMIILAIAALAVSQTASEIEAKFTDFSLETDALQIKARLFIPENYDSTYPYPVVLTLHGGGEGGTDNIIQVLYNQVATTWGTDEFQADNPCFIFSPQCPLYTGWNAPSVYPAVMVLLDSLINTYSIDTSRIYITGLSLGGGATWNYLGNDPDRYAAAITVCGSVFESQIDNLVRDIKHIPVWNFHGKIDNVISVNESRAIIRKYMEQGEYPLLTHHYYRKVYNLSDDQIDGYITNHIDLIYSEVPNIEHNVWDVAYRMPEAKKWLFKQRKRTISNLTLEKQGNIIDVSGDYKFDLYCPENVKQVSVWLGHVRSCDWIQLGSFDPSSGQYVFDSRTTDDHPFALLKFLAHDSLGYVIGKQYSDILSINNEENGLPYVEIVNDPTILQDTVSKPQFLLKFQLGDPEDSLLQVTISISTDNGLSFKPYSSFETTPKLWAEFIPLEELFRADQMVIRVEVSDGEHSVSAETMYFTNSLGYLNVSIPDTAFLYALIEEGVDTNGDSLISFPEAEAVDSLSINGSSKGNITNMSGIEAFINLEFLDCSDNQLTSLNVSKNIVLEELRCWNNQITSLNVSKNTALTDLACTDNQLTSLDLSKNKSLRILTCNENQLTDLDLSNNSGLAILKCSNNQLENLNLMNDTALQILQANGNVLTTLNLSTNTRLVGNMDGDVSIYSAYLGMSGDQRIELGEMPDLTEICVWEGLSLDSMEVYLEGSPNACIQTDCNGDCSIEITLTVSTDTIYQPVIIEATSSEDGMIFLVPVNTDIDMEVIRGACIDSAIAKMSTPVNIALEGIENGTYWLFATDTSGNISEPKAVTVMGVGIEKRNSENLRIYPNPTFTLLTIETNNSDKINIKITSLNGKLIISKEMEGTTHQLDLSSFQKGIYFITIRSKDFVTTRKVVKL